MTAANPFEPRENRREDESERFEYHVPFQESITELLSRIRGIRETHVLLDITDHEALRRDGSLRRTLAAAAVDVGKRVTFSFAESREKSKPVAVPVVKKPNNPPVSKKETVPRHTTTTSPVPLNIFRIPAVPLPSGRPSLVGFSLSRVGNTGRHLAVGFAALAGVLVASAVLFLAPRADVVIQPVAEPVHVQLSLRASAQTTAADASHGIFPGRMIAREESVDGVFPVQHVEERGERAQGSARLVNRTSTEQRVKGQSRLSSEDGRIFRMQESAVVPPEGSAHVRIVAEEGGSEGNLAEGRLTFVALSKDAAAVLYGEIVEPLIGGTDVQVPVLAQEDIDRVVTSLTNTDVNVDALLAEEKLEHILHDSRLVRVRVIDARAEEKLGSDVSQFHFQGTKRIEMFALSLSDARTLAETMVLGRSGEGKVLGRFIPESAFQLRDVRLEKGEADVDIDIENVIHASFDLETIQERLQGRTEEGALEYLRALPGVRDGDVRLRPFWVKRVPNIPRNIRIKVNLPS